MTTDTSSTDPTPPQAPRSFFVEDIASRKSMTFHHQIDKDKQQRETDTDDQSPKIPQITQETPVSQHLKITLIHHHYVYASEMSTLKLFKYFIPALRASDKELTVLPFDSKKLQYTSIVSNKQLEKLNKHELKLYFQPWHKEQRYSLSGFFHLNIALQFQDLFKEAPIAQWLDT